MSNYASDDELLPVFPGGLRDNEGAPFRKKEDLNIISFVVDEETYKCLG